jgi:anti-sigma regulatory factor (Ser/Thr protein kinase)
MPSLRVDADPASLTAIRRFVRAAASAEGLERARVDGLVQAVDESVTNVIAHGYRGAPGAVEVDLRRDGRDLVVIVRDDAPAFDPTTVPMPDRAAPLASRRAGGMGVFLAKEACDEMRYRPIPGGNELTLVLRDVGVAAVQARER